MTAAPANGKHPFILSVINSRFRDQELKQFDHLAFRQPDIDWQLWVEKGQRALPRKIVITTRYEVGDPQYTAVLRWNPAPKFDAGTFTLVPPAGATKIPYRTKLVADKGEAK